MRTRVNKSNTQSPIFRKRTQKRHRIFFLNLLLFDRYLTTKKSLFVSMDPLIGKVSEQLGYEEDVVRKAIGAGACFYLWR